MAKRNKGRFALSFYGNNILREVCEKVDVITPFLLNTASRMLLTMRYRKGIGLAAPQVKLPVRLVVMNMMTEDSEDLILFNPVILKISDEKVIHEESCLSIPKVWGDVERAAQVTFEYMDMDGKMVRVDADGLLSRCIQHEIDHLDGILFIDKMINKSELMEHTPMGKELKKIKNMGRNQNA